MRDTGLVLVTDSTGRVKFSMAGTKQITGQALLLQKVLKAICQSPLDDFFGKVAGLGLNKLAINSAQIEDIKVSIITGLQTIQDALTSEPVTNDEEALRFLVLEDVFVGSAATPGQKFVGFTADRKNRGLFVQIGISSRAGRQSTLTLPINDRTWYDSI